jgi:hypothetical protein
MVSTMIWLVVYFPVPTIRRDVNVTPAISKGLSSPCDTSAVAPRSVVVIGLTPTYEMDNLDHIPFADIKIGVSVTVQNLLVQLHNYRQGIDLNGFE